ncbi:MAG: oxygen-dependent coproporphyrinogen oxidase [Flavobacteriales bacterium]|nr:oxygen-dependent coproporphyrinogen oxidase [Flavobacteriales bacterium]
MDREEIALNFKNLQVDIISGLEELDGLGKFELDLWDRPGGGGGITRILNDGSLIEKGGVNFSEVYGALDPKIRSELGMDSNSFYATGVSIVIHPNHPMVPIIHMNVRYFELDDGKYWFGGGIDLTPHYVVESDAKWFHQELKKVCDKHDPSYHPKFSQWADDYFYIQHRQETRGVGGIFFDRLKEDNLKSKRNIFEFVYDVGKSFVPIYSEIVNRNRNKSFTESNKQWQLVRRGRYVEFNLVYDRGTTFGLKSGGRIESILMSLPLTASWVYNYQPAEGSEESRTLTYLKERKNWLI